MSYRYSDLGEQPEGNTVLVHLRDRAANVILLDPQNFSLYRAGQPFFFNEGGFQRQSPVRLTIPSTGHWFVVADHGGYGGRVRATVEVLGADGEREQEPQPIAG